MNEEAYGEKYKVIGRIEEIRYKLEAMLLSTENNSFRNFGGVVSFMNANPYNSHSNKSHYSSLTDSIESLTTVLDKFVDSYNSTILTV